MNTNNSFVMDTMFDFYLILSVHLHAYVQASIVMVSIF